MSASSRKYLKIIGFTALGLIAAGGITILIILSSIRDPLGPRECECELLKEWTTNLPLTPTGDHLESHEISVAEFVGGFRIEGSGLKGVTVDRDAMLDALADSGLNQRVDFDEPDRWIVSFFPGSSANDSRWSFDVTSIGRGIGIGIRVPVDGSPWGLETIEDLWDSYQEDYRAALAAQVERQEEAIQIIRPLQHALESMVEEE